METAADELVLVSFPTPPSFPVAELCRMVLVRGYVNHKYDYDFDRLLEYLPEINKKYVNDIVAKAVLGHCFGEMLAKEFRAWVRSQMDESLEYPDGGASIGPDGGVDND